MKIIFMKKGLLFFLLFISSFCSAQIIIKGKVLHKNKPLEGAAVYFNNTMIGTTTNSEGEFAIKAPEGKHELIVSFLGFKTINYSLSTSTYNKQLIFSLTEEENVLDEIILKQIKYDEEWKYNLSRFKKAFLGRSKLAEQCEILNDKDLYFEFDYKTNTLTAFARKPLKIKHKALGYLITYDLVDFSIDNRQKFFSGYARYQNLRKSIRKKWKQNRLRAYNGSQMHFLRSLIAKKLNEDGFLVNQFKRVLNPDRPSDSTILKAREIIKLARVQVNFSKKIITPKNAIDSALVTIRKSRLPKFEDFLYKTNVPYKDIFTTKNNTYYLNFENYLSIVYKNEPEEENFLKGMFGKKRKGLDLQTSSIVLTNGKTIIDKTGVLEPTSFFNEGYWSFEAFGDMLPLDYKPPKD